MRKIFNFGMIIFVLLGVSYSQGPVAIGSDIKDYESFKKRVEFERSKLKEKFVTVETGPVKEKLRRMGIVIAPKMNWAHSKDKKRTAHVSPDKQGVAVIDGTTRTINIFDSNGKEIRKIPIRSRIEGLIGFSETRLFDFKGGFGDSEGGFYIYNLKGELLKKVEDSGIVDRFAVSRSQKYLAITSGSPETGDFVAMYDMDGNKIWQSKVDAVGNSEIVFAPDDSCLLVKIPGSKTAYIFLAGDGKRVSKEEYAE